MATRWFAEASYVRKWIVLGVVIGVIAGLGAVVFYEALKAATHLFLAVLAGYTVPTPIGEGNVAVGADPARPWALPLIVGGGALLGGLLVFTIAPEAEGHGTDAAIAAVHHNPRGVRFRTVLVKIVASALTIGSGGSGGREGPTGQISAGFGSLLARVLELSPEDARIAVATGIGSGIGAIFSAPLGGAVLSAEIIYRDDFDPAALLPSFIAAGIGYAIFGGFEGYGALFGNHGSTDFTAPANLPWFAVIGIIGGLIGLLYARGFYGMHDWFSRWSVPRWLKPAIGGVLVGLMAIAMPEVLGTGYGWIQHGLGEHLKEMPLWIVLALPLARILATGLSIGSGGSGGIFGPGMVIGAFVGAAVWRLFEPIAPGMGGDPAPFVIVGMMCSFGSVARAPLAVLLMVAEMTGSIAAIEPGMIAVGLAWLIVRRTDVTMYRSQLLDREHAPGRRLLEDVPLLSGAPVAAAMDDPKVILGDHLTVGAARLAMAGARVGAAPVVDRDERFEGAVRAAALLTGKEDAPLRALVDAGAASVPLSSTVDVAVDALASGESTFVTVLDEDRKVVGTLAIHDLASAYRRELQARAGATGSSGSSGAPDPPPIPTA